MSIQIIDLNTFEEFLEELRQRHSIRLAKLADYGFVSTLKTSTGGTVLAPQLKVVATAFDKVGNTLIRWSSSHQPNGKATIGLVTVKVRHGNVKVAADKRDLQKWLELDGYSVSEGEWNPEEISQMLATH